MICSLSCVQNIETKGLSKSFQIFVLLRLEPQVSTPQRRVGVTSLSNSHNLVCALGTIRVRIVFQEHQTSRYIRDNELGYFGYKRWSHQVIDCVCTSFRVPTRQSIWSGPLWQTVIYQKSVCVSQGEKVFAVFCSFTQILSLSLYTIFFFHNFSIHSLTCVKMVIGPSLGYVF